MLPDFLSAGWAYFSFMAPLRKLFNVTRCNNAGWDGKQTYAEHFNHSG
jgi:hypothetical protein